MGAELTNDWALLLLEFSLHLKGLLLNVLQGDLIELQHTKASIKAIFSKFIATFVVN